MLFDEHVCSYVSTFKVKPDKPMHCLILSVVTTSLYDICCNLSPMHLSLQLHSFDFFVLLSKTF